MKWVSCRRLNLSHPSVRRPGLRFLFQLRFLLLWWLPETESNRLVTGRRGTNPILSIPSLTHDPYDTSSMVFMISRVDLREPLYYRDISPTKVPSKTWMWVGCAFIRTLLLVSTGISTRVVVKINVYVKEEVWSQITSGWKKRRKKTRSRKTEGRGLLTTKKKNVP